MKQIIVWLMLGMVIPGLAAGESFSPPERVVSLGPIITEMIYLLDADDRLIADTTYCVVPEDAKQKEKIGSMIQMNVEKIVNMKPDLVLASPLAKEKQLRKLEQLGIRVIRLVNPTTFPEMCDMTMAMGRLLGKTENAGIAVENARKEVDAVLAVTRTLPKRRVFIQIGIKPLKTATRTMFVNEYIEFAGGINIALNEESWVYSREKVLREDPDVILIATMGSSATAGENQKDAWLSYKSIKAAKNHEIYVLDSETVCSPTIATFGNTLKDIARLLHPGVDALK